MPVPYDADFARWGAEQADALRSGRLDALDREHLAEEIEGLVRSDKRALASQIERLVLHLLKWRYQLLLRSVSWQRSIIQARTEIADLLADSPSLEREVATSVERRYRAARAGAIVETGMPLATFPKVCPFAMGEILDDAGMGETEDLDNA